MKLNYSFPESQYPGMQGGKIFDGMQLSVSGWNGSRVSVSDNDIDSRSDPLTQGDPYVTSYVCLTAPRFEEHLLTGDLSEQLRYWMRDLCISFGWQLKFIDIRPEYMHWVMAVSITTYPTQFMKIFLRETSRKIFDDFPRFKHRNMSNDFWAPLYFVGVGESPYPQNSIRSFIQQIRMEQGY